MPVHNITQIEIPALPQAFNFTDGHAHRSWTPDELTAVRRATHNIGNLTREDQPRLEAAYLGALFAIGPKSRTTHSWICASASQAIEIVANILRLQHRSAVCLVEPCFDNLADIFKRHGAKLHPISDRTYQTGTICDGLPESFDACCLVSPNNPTGAVLSGEDIRQLIESCEATNGVLIIDSAFRVFDADDVIDLYGLLNSARCPWAIIEDTGKTWPTLELKGPVLSVSDSLAEIAYDIYTDMLLHPSPLTLVLLIEMLQCSERDQMAAIRSIVTENRAELARTLGKRFTIESAPFMSVAWVRTSPFTGETFTCAIAKDGIYALPGRRFYWTGHGDIPYVRFALNRDQDKYRAAMTHLERALERLDLSEQAPTDGQ